MRHQAARRSATAVCRFARASLVHGRCAEAHPEKGLIVALKLLRNKETSEVSAVYSGTPAAARGDDATGSTYPHTQYAAGWEDITALMGSGGSAFAHLASDVSSENVMGGDNYFAAGTLYLINDTLANAQDFESLGFQVDGDANIRLGIHGDGSLHFGDGTGAPDLSLVRAAAGVLEVGQNGGGFKLHSPDGTQTKTLRLSNAGAVELV